MRAAVPGELSEPVSLFDRKALVYISKRELWKRADAGKLRDNAKSSVVSTQGLTLLGDWFFTVRDKWNEQFL